MQIDPAIAEAMGFSGFGMQGNKKRKHGDEDTYTFTSTSAQDSASTQATSGPNAGTAGTQQAATTGEAKDQAAQQVENADDGKPTLEALRRGVRNAQGDMVYFLPSFIEDPWKDLKKQ